MKTKNINEINKIYELELEKIVSTVRRERAKFVLLQFPEGMKPYAQVICNEIEKKAGCSCFIWMGSCFGACDIPLEVEGLGVELIVQFGHSAWKFKNKNIKILS